MEQVTGFEFNEELGEYIPIFETETEEFFISIDSTFANYFLHLQEYLEYQNNYFKNIVEGYVYKLFESKLAGSGFESPSTLATAIMQKDYWAQYIEDTTQLDAFADMDEGTKYKTWSEGAYSFSALTNATKIISGTNYNLIAGLVDYYENIGEYTSQEIDQILNNLDESDVSSYIIEAFAELREGLDLVKNLTIAKAGTLE